MVHGVLESFDGGFGHGFDGVGVGVYGSVDGDVPAFEFGVAVPLGGHAGVHAFESHGQPVSQVGEDSGHVDFVVARDHDVAVYAQFDGCFFLALVGQVLCAHGVVPDLDFEFEDAALFVDGQLAGSEDDVFDDDFVVADESAFVHLFVFGQVLDEGAVHVQVVAPWDQKKVFLGECVVVGRVEGFGGHEALGRGFHGFTFFRRNFAPQAMHSISTMFGR